MLSLVIMVTPPLAASVTETKGVSHRVGETTRPGPLFTAAEIA